MEAQVIAQNPIPVHHRIPSFVGASAAAKKVKVLTFQTVEVSGFYLVNEKKTFFFSFCWAVGRAGGIWAGKMCEGKPGFASKASQVSHSFWLVYSK